MRDSAQACKQNQLHVPLQCPFGLDVAGMDLHMIRMVLDRPLAARKKPEAGRRARCLRWPLRKAHEIANAVARGRNVRLPFIRVDARTLPSGDSSFTADDGLFPGCAATSSPESTGRKTNGWSKP